MTKALLYSRQAQNDLDEIFDLIAVDNPRRARSHVAEIMQSCATLRESPLIGIARPDLRYDIRILTIRRRVVIVYRTTQEHVEILRIFTGGRDYETIMGQG